MKQFTGPDGQEDMPYLLTMGPITTSRDVKFAMLADWGAEDAEFAALVHSNLRNLKTLAGCDSSYECVILPGHSAAGNEAALGTFTPAKRRKTLIISNGPSAPHAQQIMQHIGRNHVVLEGVEGAALDLERLRETLEIDRNISHVWLTHCDAATGLVHPLFDIACIVKNNDRTLMVDARASFGAVPINMLINKIDVMVAGPDACLEAVPGVSLVFAKRDLLMAAEGACHSHSLDLFAQWQSFEATGHYRFSPPTHAMAALQQALRELDSEGGVAGREKRYRAIADAFRERMRALGFSLFLTAADHNMSVQTVLAPADEKFAFKTFQQKLRSRGFVVAHGSLTGVDSFRVGLMGQVDEKLITQLIAAIEIVMEDMGVRSFAPAKV
jgi:2-aminoethylphosphonate-pyruvate transaminase